VDDRLAAVTSIEAGTIPIGCVGVTGWRVMWVFWFGSESKGSSFNGMA